jgi:RNA polymerase sigma-70 factor (ECF subfamily)
MTELAHTHGEPADPTDTKEGSDRATLVTAIVSIGPQAQDARWIAGTRRHDEAVFDHMFVAFHERMFHYALVSLRTRDEADEAVQDVFMDIWELGPRWKPRGRVSAYLFGALRRKIIDAARRAKGRGRWLDRFLRGDVLDEILPKMAAADDRTATKELDVRVKRVLDSLPRNCRETLTFYLSGDWSYSQIAEAMGVTRETVRTQLKRAYATMRTELADLRTPNGAGDADDIGQRQRSAATHCRNGHRRTPENTTTWSGRRACATCMSLNKARRDAARAKA